MPSGDIMRATIEGTFDGEPVMINLGFVSSSEEPDFAADAAALAASLISTLHLADVGSSFLAPLSEHYFVNDIRIQDLFPGVAAGLVFPVGAAGGNATDDALPPQCALTVTWRTGLKGKENRGRSYLTGFAEDSQTTGYWIPEIQTWAQTEFADQLIASYAPPDGGAYALSVIHTQSGGVRLSPPTATPIISYSIHNEVRTLRRRGVGVRISRRRAGA